MHTLGASELLLLLLLLPCRGASLFLVTVLLMTKRVTWQKSQP